MITSVSLISCMISIAFLFVSWYFYMEDRFLFKLEGLTVSGDIMEIRSGDILRVGVNTDGSVASHWLGRPLHHYVLVQDIEGELYVIHTWYKKLTANGNIHVPPSYQLQPLSQFAKYSPMSLVEIFRHPDISNKSISRAEAVRIISSFGASTRCYITIMNLIDELYPELNIDFYTVGSSRVRNNCLWSFFMYKPLYFEQSLTDAGFQHFNIMLLEKIVSYK